MRSREFEPETRSQIVFPARPRSQIKTNRSPTANPRELRGGAATMATGGGDYIRDGRSFLAEIWRRGEPDMRPEYGRIVLARTAGMAALEESYRGRVLFATVEGDLRVTAAALLAAMEVECGVAQSSVKVEVTCPPYHFFVQFDSPEDCTRVVMSELRSGDTRIRFRRWGRCGRGKPGKFQYLTTLSIEGLPEEAQEPQAVRLVLAALHGELIDMLPATDRWVVPVSAWLRDPSAVPKTATMVVPTPILPPVEPDSDEDAESPPPPRTMTEKGTMEYELILHVKDVIDRGRLLTDLPDEYLPDDDEDLSRIHIFDTWRGKIDGTGPGAHGPA